MTFKITILNPTKYTIIFDEFSTYKQRFLFLKFSWGLVPDTWRSISEVQKDYFACWTSIQYSSWPKILHFIFLATRRFLSFRFPSTNWNQSMQPNLFDHNYAVPPQLCFHIAVISVSKKVLIVSVFYRSGGGNSTLAFYKITTKK